MSRLYFLKGAPPTDAAPPALPALPIPAPAKAKGPQLPPIRQGDWLQTADNALPAELIKGVLHKGCKMVIGAGSKSRKTWTLIDLALSVATGQPWMGFETNPGPVLFCNFEVAEPFFVDRLRAVARARRVAIPDSFSAWNLRGFSTEANTLLPKLATELGELKPSLIVLDPVYKMTGGAGENDAGSVGELCNAVEQLAVTTGAAVIFAAHFSKGNQALRDAMDRISGSGVFARDPDAIITLTRHAEDGCLTVDSILRNCPEIPPFVVEWDFPLLARREDLDPADLKQARVAGKKAEPFTIDDLIALLAVGETIRPTARQKRAKDSIGIGPSRFWELLKAAKSKGTPKLNIQDREGWTRLL